MADCVRSPVQQVQSQMPTYGGYMEEVDPCTGDVKQGEREKPRSPALAVKDPSCFLPESDPDPQKRFANVQTQGPNGVSCYCPGLSPHAHAQDLDYIPQPENRPVEALAACQPAPCVCDAPPCQEQPQKEVPCYLPELRDKFPPPEATTAEGQESQKMGVIGPWATGRVDWGPLAGLTGTRPVVDRYSITRYSEGEWRKHNADMLMSADKENHHAKIVDFNGRQCANFTATDTDKKQSDNTLRLSQRAHEVHRWKVELEHAINAMADEINTLALQRQRLRTAMGVLRMPESIAGECLDRRTGRLEPDLVRDKAEEELIKESALISEVRDLMERMLKQMEEQLRHNKAIKQRVEMDWSDKKENYDIEAVNVGLRNTSSTLLFRPGATRFPDGQSTPESWEHHTKENLSLLEAERQRSIELRHFLDSFMNDIARDLRMQADRVDTALAMRISETDEARQRLENELLKILRRIADTEKLIADLKQAIRNQDAGMKKAQTRLHNRLLRPRQESCRDVPQYGLVDEVKSIGESVSALKAQLQQAEESLYGLTTIRGDLEREIIVKRKTLYIDKDRCREIRSHYPSTVALTGY
ncbi:tektin-4 isoform X2 [Periplaneta americana]|uniref:tektin-4 isoform X2 n=1 Tax=Periplaneta americana TaxID=6978 RepID=UPI0037E752A6